VAASRAPIAAPWRRQAPLTVAIAVAASRCTAMHSGAIGKMEKLSCGREAGKRQLPPQRRWQ